MLENTTIIAICQQIRLALRTIQLAMTQTQLLEEKEFELNAGPAKKSVVIFMLPSHKLRAHCIAAVAFVQTMLATRTQELGIVTYVTEIKILKCAAIQFC